MAIDYHSLEVALKSAGNAAALKTIIDSVDGLTASVAELNIMDGVTATAAEINAAADVSGRVVIIPDADTALAASDSGRPHLVSNVSADRTFTLPSPSIGLDFTLLPNLYAADGHDWIISTGSDTNYFTGGIGFHDSDAGAGADEVIVTTPDGNSNSKIQVNLPAPGTQLRFICDGTLWNMSGMVVSTTAPVFADQ